MAEAITFEIMQGEIEMFREMIRVDEFWQAVLTRIYFARSHGWVVDRAAISPAARDRLYPGIGGADVDALYGLPLSVDLPTADPVVRLYDGGSRGQG